MFFAWQVLLWEDFYHNDIDYQNDIAEKHIHCGFSEKEKGVHYEKYE